MKIGSSTFFSALIILIGVGYLLANLGVVAITPWQLFVTYWPIIVIGFAIYKIISGLVRRRRFYFKTVDLIFWIVVILLSFNILAPRIGIQSISLTWGLIWPVLLIIFGITQLSGGKSFVRIQLNGRPVEGSSHSHTSLIGEVRKGSDSWALDDTYLRHGIGSVELDLTRAIIPDREVIIDVAGLIGEVTLYLPPDLPIKADCQLDVGNIVILDQNVTGTHRRIEMQSPDYSEATRKLDIRIHWKIGDVTIRRIG